MPPENAQPAWFHHMSTSERIFTNAVVVLPDTAFAGTVVTRNGLIAAVDEGATACSGAIDCDGDLIIPGLVELHTDNVERHIMPRPGTLWPTASAMLNHDREIAAGGITTVLNALCVGEVHSRSVRSGYLSDICEAMAAHIAAGAFKADHHLHWRCEVSYGGLMEMLEPLMDAPRLRLISVMDHTPGQRQFVQTERYAEYYQGKFNMTDEEVEAFMAQRRRDQEMYSAANRARVVAESHARAIPIASHDDARAGHVEEAIRDRITVAEFPTTLESARASHEAGLAVLMGGPNIVRGKSHSGNVSARELAEHGYLDIISSDYVPASLLWGALLLEEALPAITLPQAIATVTRNPARAVGFEDRGEIRPGLRADLVRVRRGDSAPVIRDVWVRGERVA
jgi:alpha-D-ribose 1-methylphosphonate 5-triphosphate diphosphatase